MSYPFNLFIIATLPLISSSIQQLMQQKHSITSAEKLSITN